MTSTFFGPNNYFSKGVVDLELFEVDPPQKELCHSFPDPPPENEETSFFCHLYVNLETALLQKIISYVFIYFRVALCKCIIK